MNTEAYGDALDCSLRELTRIGAENAELKAKLVDITNKANKAKPGRPEEMTGGARHNIYLDAASWARAVELGNGNASAGIRDALKQLKGE